MTDFVSVNLKIFLLETPKSYKENFRARISGS